MPSKLPILRTYIYFPDKTSESVIAYVYQGTDGHGNVYYRYELTHHVIPTEGAHVYFSDANSAPTIEECEQNLDAYVSLFDTCYQIVRTDHQ